MNAFALVVVCSGGSFENIALKCNILFKVLIRS